MANERFVLQVYVGTLSPYYEALSIEASKQTTAEEIVECIAEKLSLKHPTSFELAEITGKEGTDNFKEKSLNPSDFPVQIQLHWPETKPKSSFFKNFNSSTNNNQNHNEPSHSTRFCLRKKPMQCMNWSFSWTDTNDSQSQLLKDYFLRFLYQPKDKEYPDLCQLPDLTEQTLLENLKARFERGHIYTYCGTILIAVNPFKFFPIYNPKYVQHYQNRKLGELPPHVFAIADSAYQTMLRKRYNQCIVISGESGSGKTESTNLLLHHLTALSHKGTHGSGVEQIILGAGPVLEAFGNSKTSHNNNSSRFGKFIQVNYKENGMVHSAVVQKYLLEKSRIISQAKNERNYHVFYYLLAGAPQAEKDSLYLTKASDYTYLNQSKCYTLDGVDEAYEYSRLKQSLEMVGFTNEKHKRLNSVISAVLHIGNVEFTKKSTYHCDEAVMIKNQEEVSIVSKLLMVKEETLTNALICKRTKTKSETITINYKTQDAIATRDAMAKCLYGALFEWIVMQVNQALLIKKDLRDHKGNYIGVLDIFGFEDFGDQNYFEQFNINIVNEKLHNYFNQHIFKYEQEEYQREDINWTNIDFHDNIACLQLIEGKICGLLSLLDEQSSFPASTNQNVFQKFVNHHKDNPLFEVPPCRQSAFVIKHYAGKVKYQIKDFREKNLDLMRSDIVCLLKSSSSGFVRELVGQDPLSIFRWQILKAFFKAYFIFTKLREESKKRRAAQEEAVATSKQAKKFDFDSKNINESKTAIKKSNRTSITSNSAFQRFHNSILNANNVNNNLTTNSNKIQPRKLLINNGTIQFNRDNNSSSNDANVLHEAHKILQKSKLNRPPSFKNSKGIQKSIKNLQTLKAIVGKSSGVVQTRIGRKQTPTVTFQFQQSLNHLMETLNQANPFFVRCIKSNSSKTPNNFDDMLVLVQLRYTGMLETVRIRQSGYSVRLTFEEFIQHYRILLPKGLLSSRIDIKEFLQRMNLNQENYQMGKTKVFMRESEKLALDDILHQEILKRIIILQRWVRTWLTHKKFNQVKHAVLIIQKHVRRWLAQQRLLQLKWTNMYEQWAATTIQKTWKCFKDRNSFVKFRNATINFQANVRGFLSRQRFRERLASFHKSRSSSSATVVSPPVFSSTISTPMITTTIKNVSIVNSASRRPSEDILSNSSSRKQSAEPEISHLTNFTHYSTNKASKELKSPSSNFKKSSEDSIDMIDDYELNQLMNRKKSSVSSLSKLSQPPLLPPRKQSQISNISTASESSNLPTEDDLQGDDDEEFDSNRLDRGRNKPFRKLSIKRSKSSKIEDNASSEFEVVKSPSETDLIKSKTTNQLDQVYARTPPSSFDQNQTEIIQSTQPIQKNAFQKAKKQIKTFIIGGSSRAERKSKENLVDGDQQPSDEINSSRLRKQSSETTNASILGAVNQNNSLSSSFSHAIGHNLVNYLNCSKSDICSVCENNVSQGDFNNGLKCSDCDLLFHNNCSASAVQIPCVSKKSVEFYTNSAFSNLNQPSTFGFTKNVQQTTGINPSRPPRNKHRNKPVKSTSANSAQTSGSSANKGSPYSSRSSSIGSKQQSTGSTTNKFGYNNSSSWNVTRTSEFIDSFDVMITDVTELHYMEIFIGNKLCEMEQTKTKQTKESMIDVVFKNALKEFKCNLISTYSVASQDGRLHITYKSLIEHFELVVSNVCQNENSCKSTNNDIPITIAVNSLVNAFRCYLDEFRNLAKFNSEDKPKYEKQTKQGLKRKRGGKKKVNRDKEDSVEKYGHKFYAVTANIPTVCEVCQSLMWLTEKIWVCKESKCKFTCHKKCINKLTTDCRNILIKIDCKRVFGSPLENLVDEDNLIPVVLDKLITAIELKGLYTEGIYRKSGTTSKINELKQKLDNCDENVDLDSYSVHVLTAVFKSFLRDMPEPLMTFNLYSSFLLATAITDPQEKIQTLFSHINKLPRCHYDVLERLIFHLARVAQQENANRMNTNSLSIIFAPCVLRTDKPMQMQDKIYDISKQTAVLECIINERLKQVRDTLDDIFILDKACHTASSRLSSLRLSKLNLNRDNTVQIRNPNEIEDEEAILAQQIKHLRTEKALLTNMLPSFRLTGSDEDLLDIENESMIGQDFDDLLPSPTRALNFKFHPKDSQIDLGGLETTDTQQQQSLRHLTKNRVSAPKQKRRLPSKHQNQENANPVEKVEKMDTNLRKDSKKEFNSKKSKFETKKPIVRVNDNSK